MQSLGKTLRRLAVPGLALAALAAAWWLFGWRTEDNPALGRFRYCRYFGRYTKIQLDVDRDGRPDAEVRYSWKDPYIGFVHGTCGDSHTSIREDRNLDGKWDTWTWHIDEAEPDPCTLRMEADTTGDGQPDWSTTLAFGDSQDVYARLKALRGF